MQAAVFTRGLSGCRHKSPFRLDQGHNRTFLPQGRLPRPPGIPYKTSIAKATGGCKSPFSPPPPPAPEKCPWPKGIASNMKSNLFQHITSNAAQCPAFCLQRPPTVPAQRKEERGRCEASEHDSCMAELRQRPLPWRSAIAPEAATFGLFYSRQQRGVA